MFLVPLNRDSRQFSRLLDDTLERFLGGAAADAPASLRSPSLDVTETEKAYTARMELPGVSKDEIQISVEGRQVSVQAQSQPTQEKKDGERVIYRERSASSYARSFTLPVELDQSGAVAKLDQGVLTLTLPKRDAATAARIAVS